MAESNKNYNEVSFDSIEEYQAYLNKYELDNKMANEAWERVRASREIHLRQLDLYSMTATKTPVLVAAGGIAAVLGFYSANYAILSIDVANLVVFNQILGLFFFKLALWHVGPLRWVFQSIFFHDCWISRKVSEL